MARAVVSMRANAHPIQSPLLPVTGSTGRPGPGQYGVPLDSWLETVAGKTKARRRSRYVGGSPPPPNPTWVVLPPPSADSLFNSIH